MGNVLASNDGSEIDDDVTILAFLQAEESIVLSELLAEEPVTGMKFRRVFPRPNYRDSVWWRMLEKGDCKIPGSREYKLFRRRFGVGLRMKSPSIMSENVCMFPKGTRVHVQIRPL